MKKSQQQEIDSLAKGIFQTLVPKWAVNEHRCEDFGKDYIVETVDANRQLTGDAFYVQLKGTSHPRFSKDRDCIKYYLKKKYALYYMDKVKDLPVFLVHIDVKARNGWWIFLQPSLDGDSRWRTASSVPIKIPLSHDLSDVSRLEAAVKAAKQWMRKRHPDALIDAVAGEQERVRSIDPRFDLDISITGSSIQRTIIAREPVAVRFDLALQQSDEAKDRMQRFLRGELVQLQPGEIAVDGSPLFDELVREGGGVSFSFQRPASMSISARDSEGNELAHLSHIPGNLLGGLGQFRFESGPSSSPVDIEMGPFERGVTGSLKFNFTFTNWDGQPLSRRWTPSVGQFWALNKM